jgi:hypothetical protein
VTTAEPHTAQSAAREGALTLLVLVAGGVFPLLVVTATAGWAPMSALFYGIGVPGILIVAAVWLYARRTGLDRLSRRIWLGVVGGIVLTMALDVVRVAGVHLGYLPDSVTMFGNLIANTSPMADPTASRYLIGELYHYLNGISFALVYSIAFGRTRWWGPVTFSVLVWIGMMTLPPMAPKFGPFGLDRFDVLINGYAVSTLLAHVAMGLALAAIINVLARDRGVLFAQSSLFRPATAQ